MTAIPAAAQALRPALEAAVRAPSPHNSQPWRFVLGRGYVHVFLDRSRILRVADPDGREARMSCGAALFNLQVTLRAAGNRAHSLVLPDSARPDLLATVWFNGGPAHRAEDRALADAVHKRHTSRRPFFTQALPASIRHELLRAGNTEGCALVLPDEHGLAGRVGSILRHAELSQREDTDFLVEAREWTATDPARLDGVPVANSGPPPIDDHLLLRDYGGDSGRKPREYEPDPTLAVLVSRDDDERAHVRAGVAMQRVLLTATRHGVGTSFLSAGVEVPASRSRLRTVLTDCGYPQAVLRFGYGYPVPTTSRRPVTAVLDIELCWDEEATDG